MQELDLHMQNTLAEAVTLSVGSNSEQVSVNAESNGGYKDLVSVDDMQRYKLQTSTFDARFRRTTGRVRLKRNDFGGLIGGLF